MFMDSNCICYAERTYKPISRGGLDGLSVIMQRNTITMENAHSSGGGKASLSTVDGAM